MNSTDTLDKAGWKPAAALESPFAEALIDAHLGQGNRFEAVQCFRALASQLRDELGIDPNGALAARVKAQAGSRFVA